MTSSSGWHVKESILTDLFKGTAIPSDERILENKLCDLDIRDFGEPCLSNCMSKETLTGPVVLQLIRYRNVSQPKLKNGLHGSDDVGRVSLTDGHTSISAILLDNVKGINADTPPGTKLLISGMVNVENGFLTLNSSNVKVVGGRVEKLIDKWMIEQHLIGDNQLVGRSDCKAPRWISFGKKNIGTIDASTLKFRANDVLKTANEKDTNDESVFEQQRRENIQAIRKENAKVFISPKIQAPLRPEKLRLSKEIKPSVPPNNRNVHCPRKQNSRRRRAGSDDEEVPAVSARSSRPSTLFDFLTANVASEVAPDSTLPNCASTQDAKFRNYESKHSRYQHNHASSDQKGLVKRNLLDRESNTIKQRKEEKREPGRTLKGSEINRESKRDSRSEKAQRLSDNMRNSVRAQTSKQMNRGSDRFQTGISVNDGARGAKSQMNVSLGGDPAQDGIVQNFSNISIANGPTGVPKMLFDPKSHKGSYMQKVRAWKLGDQCHAPWSDGQYYLATIVAIGPSGLCVVRYNDYGNTCTVPQEFLLSGCP